jgi:hypothetical protein
MMMILVTLEIISCRWCSYHYDADDDTEINENVMTLMRKRRAVTMVTLERQTQLKRKRRGGKEKSSSNVTLTSINHSFLL